MDKQTQEIIEGVVAITIEYGVDIVGAIVLARKKAGES